MHSSIKHLSVMPQYWKYAHSLSVIYFEVISNWGQVVDLLLHGEDMWICHDQVEVLGGHQPMQGRRGQNTSGSADWRMM